MIRTKLLFLVTALGLVLVPGAFAGIVTFEAEALGTEYGTPTGDSPGDLVFSEDGVDVLVQTFISGGSPTFGFGKINPYFPSRNFYVGNNLRFNNIGFEFDFGGVGTEASFQYMNLGGSINLSINGGTPVEASSFANLPGTIGGATVSVTQVPVSGGVKGTVTLTGSVSSVRIGGQELFVDEVTGDGSGDPGGNGDPEYGCDITIDHETLVDGTVYGSGAGMNPGDFMFAESGVPVYVDVLATGGGDSFGDAKVLTPGIAGFGSDQALIYQGASGFYLIADLDINVKAVRFEFADFGGVENLEVNGEGLYVGNIANLPSQVADGVTATVETTPIGGGIRGVVTLTGNVQKLLIGGQEFIVDEFCIDRGISEIGTCGPTIDFESQDFGAAWGSDEGDDPGDLIFTEDDIEVYVLPFDDGTSDLFGLAFIDEPACSQITSQAMVLKQISLGFLLSDIEPVTYGRFDFCECDGNINLFVDGTLYEGPITGIPFDYFGGGYECDVTITDVSGDCLSGYVEISGPLSAIYVGGELIQVDNFCFDSDATSDTPEFTAAPTIAVESYPNPFHLRTHLRLALSEAGPVELAVFDLTGRRVATLVDRVLPAGSHQVTWEGRSGLGDAVPAGIYLVRLRQGDEIFTRKVAVTR